MLKIRRFADNDNNSYLKKKFLSIVIIILNIAFASDVG